MDNKELGKEYLFEAKKTFFQVENSYFTRETPTIYFRAYIRRMLHHIFLLTQQQIQELEKEIFGQTTTRDTISTHINNQPFPEDEKQLEKVLDKFTKQFEFPSTGTIRTKISNKLMDKIFKGWSYKKLAEELGVSSDTVKALLDEKGKNISYSKLIQIANILL